MLKCQRCNNPVDYLTDRGATKRIKRGDGVYHDKCWERHYIEKNAWPDDYKRSVCCGASFIGESDFCSKCKDHSGPDEEAIEKYMDKVEDQKDRWGDPDAV